MKESLARTFSGLAGLGESPSHDAAPVDKLLASGLAQSPSGRGACDAAMEAGYLCSLGADLVRLKVSNVSSAYGVCRERIAVALLWRRDSLRISESEADAIAGQCLSEHIIDFCPSCHGRGETPSGDGRDGSVPMKACGECGGHGVRRYTNDERSEGTGIERKMDRAYSECHGVISRAVSEFMRTYLARYGR